jgi:hypothetical protein
MLLVKNVEGNEILNKGKGFSITKKHINDVVKCMKELNYDSLWLEPNKTIVKSKLITVDINKKENGFQNIKIHLNNSKEEVTIAQVLVNEKELKSEKDESIQSHILRRVKYGLTRSLETGKLYYVELKNEKTLNQKFDVKKSHTYSLI